jgi:hypothetical protein
MTAIEMLEVLKEDYLGMQFKVELDKEILAGFGGGLIITEQMNFVDWNDALRWARQVNARTDGPFIVLELRNLVTDQTWVY